MGTPAGRGELWLQLLGETNVGVENRVTKNWVSNRKLVLEGPGREHHVAWRQDRQGVLQVSKGAKEARAGSAGMTGRWSWE